MFWLIVLLPLYFLGFILGFIIKPICEGIVSGYYHLELKHNKKLLDNIDELNDEIEDMLMDNE